MKAWWRRVRPYVLSGPIYWIARIIGLTLKFQSPGWDEAKSIRGGKIFAGWHGRTFAAATFYRGMGVWTIISQSRDGEMQNRIFTRFGFKTIRGSSGRGGIQALRQSIEVLKKGESMAFTPDGPRGPTQIVQPGIVLMARKSGSAVIPCGVGASRGWLAPSWDSYLIPFPFSRVELRFGQPMRLGQDASEEEAEIFRLELQKQLTELQSLAEASVNSHFGKIR